MSQISLSEDQRRVFDKLEWFLFQDDTCKELRIGGLAGTGKTTVLAHFIKSQFTRIRSTYPDTAVGALTGKAAERINFALGEANTQKSAKTLHKILFTVEMLDSSPQEFEDAVATELADPTVSRGSTLLDDLMREVKDEKPKDDFESRIRIVENLRLPSLIFVDEASMVSKEYYDLLMDPSKGVRKIVFIGDHGQLPPITKPKEPKFNLMGTPHITLTEIHRQLKGNPVIELAHDIRKAKNARQIQNMINASPLRKISPDFAIRGSIEYATRDGFTWNDIAHIVYKNATRCEINRKFIDALGNEQDAPVICLKNTELPNGEYVANGSRGLLKKRRPTVSRNGRSYMSEITIDFPHIDAPCTMKAPNDAWLSEKYSRWFKDRTIVPTDYAYAITCHKAQGSSWKTVVVWTKDMVQYDFDDYKRWVYTAITRAEENVMFIV